MDPADAERLKQALALQGSRVGQHETALKEILESLSKLTTRVDQIAAHLVSINPPIPAAAAATNQASSMSLERQPIQPREPFIPTPSRYSGEAGTCSQFLHQCMLVFEQQPLTYCNDRAKVAFIMSLLAGKASAWAVALTNSNSPHCNTLDGFISEMRKVFDHPLQTKEASNRLLSLRQGSGSVSTYSVDFRILATECGWDEKALQGVFLRGLSEEVKDELAARDETNSLEDLISLAIRLDTRLRERRRERSVRRGPSYPSARQLSATPVLHSDQSSPTPFVTTPTVSEEPMQLGRMKLSPEERLRRINQRLCMYCGEAGHIVPNCPVRPKDNAHQPPEGRW